MVEAEKIGIATIINYQKCIFANKVKLEELFC